MDEGDSLRAFGASLCILAALMLVPCLIALASGEPSAGAFLFSAIIAAMTGASAIIGVAGRPSRSDFRDAVTAILAWWVVTPVFAGLPFLLTGAGVLDAYFEAVSAMTTTGAWISEAGAVETKAGMIWRAMLQWLGGLASLAIGAAIFIRPAFIGIDTLLPTISSGDAATSLQAIRNGAAAFLAAYVALTVAAFIAQLVAGADIVRAAVISLSVVASGGFLGDAGGLDGAAAGFIVLLAPFVILSGANFIFLTRMMQGTAERTRDVETGVYLIAILVVGVGFWIAAGAGDLDLIPAQIFNAASLFSTNGFIIGDGPTLPLALVTVIIGGSAVSTAGGFKILRWMVIFRRAREEIRLLIMPRADFGKSSIANEFGVWIHFLVFTMTLGGMILLITLAGHSFELAATAATAVLANAGPVIALAEGGEAGYAVFSAPVRLLLCAGMILGRLEAVVALAIFNRAFWRS